MIVGVPTEVKDDEYRVGLTPRSVRELVHHGHAVLVQADAGHAIGLFDEDYERMGATIVTAAEDVFADAELIVKVKEPRPAEVAMLRDDQALFTYLHLAPDPGLTKSLTESGAIAIAYETVTDRRGRLPLLAPMSEVAGRMAVQAGAHTLEIAQGGRGVLLGGVPGTLPGNVTVIGGGVVGTNAARVALGMEADVTILDVSLDRLAELDLAFGPALKTVYSTYDAIYEHVQAADLVIGAVLVPGSTTPELVTEDMIKAMHTGAVVVDVAIDQGGCIATSKPTTHSNPTFVKHGVVHYCVANMPGAVARTATFALNNATLPYVLAIANKGVNQALADDLHLRDGLNVYCGHVTQSSVAAATGHAYVDPLEAMKNPLD